MVSRALLLLVIYLITINTKKVLNFSDFLNAIPNK